MSDKSCRALRLIVIRRAGSMLVEPEHQRWDRCRHRGAPADDVIVRSIIVETSSNAAHRCRREVL